MMKKVIVVAVVALFLAGLASCNNETCPAYSKAETHQTTSNG